MNIRLTVSIKVKSLCPFGNLWKFTLGSVPILSSTLLAQYGPLLGVYVNLPIEFPKVIRSTSSRGSVPSKPINHGLAPHTLPPYNTVTLHGADIRSKIPTTRKN